MTALRCLAFALAALVAACAANDPQPVGTTTSRGAPEYRTGSNIPVRQARPAVEASERAAKQAEEPRRNGDTDLPKN